ncbi:MAG: protein of unknown function endonuclease [Acidimicrobiales bacterium]|nr:protein of unknown function endonuclease [Acidimicrobiales bacterium]
MAPRFISLARELRQHLAEFEPRFFTGAECAFLVEVLATTEKACAGAKARAAARAAECGAHRDRGYRDPEEWLARAGGTSTPQARSDIETAQRLADCPQTSEALANGELSMREAEEITRTEKECPGSENDLLETARKEGLKRLREKGRATRQAAADPDDLRRRQRAARDVHGFVDELGMVQIRGGLLPEIGIPFLNRLDAETDRLRRLAKAEGRAEPRVAHAHDAFAAMITGESPVRARGTDMVIVCDVRAYRRGHAHADEPCHIVGGSRIPVRLATELGNDAFLKAVLHDGVDIHSVAHYGRHIPAALRTALELGPPPDFDGVRCAEEGCGRRHGIEWDHVNPVANHGETSYRNLEPKCWPDHREKTERDRRAGLLDLDGALDRSIDRLKRGPP